MDRQVAGVEPGAPSPCLAARGLTLQLGGKVIFDDLTFSLDQGEFVALLGCSGTGKSTLLRVVADLQELDSGTVGVDGDIAIAFQEPRLLPWQRVWRNVLFGLPGAPGQRRSDALQALAEVGLEAKADAWPLTLSGGEAQRVSLARALIRGPQLLLLDEPFGSLDALTRQTMQDLVVRLWRAHRPTVVMVTHDIVEATRVADRIVVLDGGGFTVDVRIGAERPRSRSDPEMLEVADQLAEALGA